ncbi:MAG: hypothetical protein ACM3SQ_08590 [Betaproteobacteria bacterium]
MPTHGGGLRKTSTIALAAGAAGSVAFSLYAGYRVGAPLILQVLFAGWVFSPFLALGVARLVAKRWPPPIASAIDTATLVVAAASVAIYGAVAVAAPRPKTAVFVIVAPASWLVIATALATAGLMSRKVDR